MAIRKDSSSRPEISEITPPAAIAGGELQIKGTGFAHGQRPSVSLGNVPAHLVVGSDSLLIARVPENATIGKVTVGSGENTSSPWMCDIGVQIADGLHPVSSPAVDSRGVAFSTFSGTRGQKTPVAVFRVDANSGAAPFITDLMNATALAFDRDGMLYISSRFDGVVYQAEPNGSLSVYVEGMGVATGMCFDSEDNLFVGDRSGTIFKISRNRQIYVFATLESSISAYHLTFGPDGYLYVTGPTTSSFDCVQRISPAGEVDVYYRGLGRPQGLAFDAAGRLYVAASIGGKRGVVRITPDRVAEYYISGPNIAGLAFSPTRDIIVSTNNALYRINAGIEGYFVHN